jgi:hypothetical protein
MEKENAVDAGKLETEWAAARAKVVAMLSRLDRMNRKRKADLEARMAQRAKIISDSQRMEADGLEYEGEQLRQRLHEENRRGKTVEESLAENTLLSVKDRKWMNSRSARENAIPLEDLEASLPRNQPLMKEIRELLNSVGKGKCDSHTAAETKREET